MKRKTRLNASPADNSAKLQKHVDATDTEVSPETTAPTEAEKSTHRREGFFRSLVENSLDGMMVLNLEGIIQFVNDACAEIVGSEPEDMIGKSVFPLIHPDDVQKATKMRENLIRNLGAREYSTIRMLHRDGSWCLVEGMGTSILDESRKLVTLSTLRDITARRRAEETLAESEGLFRRLSESIFDGIVIHEEGRILEINPAMLIMLGCERAETIGRLIWEFVTTESAQVIQTSIRQGLTKPYEITVIRKNGPTFPAEGIGKECRYHGRACRVVALRDITERKQAETSLRESEERFHSLVQAVFDGVVMQMDNIIVEASPALALILGRELSEILGRSGMEFVTPESEQLMQRNAASGYDKPYEITLVKKDGSTVPVEILGKTCLYQGRKARIVAFRDLTEQKRMAEALRESQERMRAVLENSPDLITSVDANGNIVFANRMFRQYREEEVIGSSIYRYTRPMNKDLLRNNLAQVFASGTPARFEIAGPGEGDRTSWYEVRVGPIRQDGRIVDAVVIASDITERKRMQDALAESEERFRAIATTARDAIVLADGEGNISYWNPAAEEMLGYTSEEAVGKSSSFLLSEELRATQEENYRSFARTGQGVRIGKVTEFPHFIRRDGSPISAEISVSAIQIKGQWHALGILRDITQRKQMERELAEYREQLERLVTERTSELERANELLRQEVSQHKRTEQALRDSEERFRELTDLLPQTVFEIDLKGDFTFANRFGFESSGYTPEDLARGLNSLRIFIPEDRNRVKENMRRRLKGEIAGGIEYTALRKDGSTFPALVYASPVLRGGEPVGLRGIVVDITERKRAEEAVRKNEHELRALLEATHDAAFLTDSEGNLIALNENFASRFGRQADELVGTNIFDLLPPELAESRRKKAYEALSSRQCIHAEDEREGRLMHSCYCPIFDDKGDLIRFAVFARDITEQRQAEERIRQLQRQQMETEKLAATGRMAARIAHEINNPLGGIKNSFELIKDAIPKEHRHYDYVGRIEKEIERITRIVRQMIDLHRPYIALSRPFRVDKTIQDIIALLEHNLRGNSVILQTHAEDARVTVTMSEDSLRQVVNNLIQNAIEASPEGGIVRIRAEVTGKTLVITVRDQGSGIPEDARLQVYEPFYTTKSSRLTGGLGLGLSIAKNLVEAMGGSLDFESIIGQGTTFTIILPIETSQKEARNG